MSQYNSKKSIFHKMLIYELHICIVLLKTEFS